MEISLAIFPESRQKHLAKRLACMAAMRAEKSAAACSQIFEIVPVRRAADFCFLLVSSGRFQYTIDKDKSAARNQQEVSGGEQGKVWIRGLRKELRPMNK